MKQSVLIRIQLLIVSLFTILICVSSTNAMGPGTKEDPPSVDKIEKILLDRLSATGCSDYVIEMTEQTDLSPAYAISDWNQRGWYVYNALRETAERSQKPIMNLLTRWGIAYQSFIAGNEIAVFGGDMDSLLALAVNPTVKYVRSPKEITLEPVEMTQDVIQNEITGTLSWGISDTHATEFWSRMGIKGEGILVANIDTGVQWDHPALDQAYKCFNDPGNPSCWKDPSNICGGLPCDNHGHGTHTMGTMVGDDDPSLPYQVGMAPEAQWIACKGCESNDCSEFALNTCADWILAPGGDPASRPQIVNNSWGDLGGDDWYRSKVQAWEAAGIFPAFSAGNDGSSCGTLGSPGDYPESFSSANHTSTRAILSSSSRGPSFFGDEPYTKPNISAPGTFIWSSYRFSSYLQMSGTSMASPHTAGAVALLWSCNPSLIGDVDTTMEILQNTADAAPAGNCGAPDDGEGNFTFGYGYLNILSAGEQACGLNADPNEIEVTMFLGDVPLSRQLMIENKRAAEVSVIITDISSGGLGEDSSWLTEDPVSGTIPADSELEVTVTFNPSEMLPGDYHASLHVEVSPEEVIDVPVTLHLYKKIIFPLFFN